MKFSIPIALIIVFNCYFGYSQNLNFFNINTDQGLASNNVYDIAQDNSGYIVLATEKGIVRYNGKSFQTLNDKQGLINKVVIRLAKDNSGAKIYFLDYEGNIGTLEKDKIKILYTNSLKTIEAPLIEEYTIDNQDNIIMTFTNQKILKFNPKIKVLNPFDPFINQSKSYNCCILIDSIKCVAIGKNVQATCDEILKIENKLFLAVANQKEIRYLSVVRLSQTEFIAGINNRLIKIDDNDIQTINTFKNPILSVLRDCFGNILVSVQNEGIYSYFNAELVSEPKLYFEGETFTKIVQDREGIYWLLTENNGLKQVNSIYFNVSIEISNSIFSLANSDTKLFCSTYDNQVYCFDYSEGRVYNKQKLDITGIGQIEDIIYLSNDQLGVLTSRFWLNSNDGKIIHNDLVAYKFKLLRTGNNQINPILYDSFVFTGSKEMFLNKVDKYRRKELSITEDFDGTIILSSGQKTMNVENGIFSFHSQKEVIISKRITTVYTTKDLFMIGYRDNGLEIIDLNNLVFVVPNEYLNSPSIKCIASSGNNTFWIGTDNGFTKLTIEDQNREKYSSDNYYFEDGLKSHDINDIFYKDGYFYLTSGNCLMSFDPELIQKSKSIPKIQITRIQINKQDTVLKQSYVLKPSQNTIEMFIDAVCIKFPDHINYTVFLNNNKLTQEKDNREIRISDLVSGNYQLKIVTDNPDLNESVETSNLSFRIKKRLPEYLAFWLAIIIIVLTIALIVFRIILKSIKRKNRNEVELLLSKLKALMAQMNPHFIFNSITSARVALLNKEYEKSDDMLVSLSSLARKILDQTEKNLIPIAEEIETLEFYLNVEQLRFKEAFTYKIEVDPLIDIHSDQIPPLLIQPYAENAILHGIRNKEGRGEIIIKFAKGKSRNIKIIICDNGIGITRSRELNKSRINHNSKGESNVMERLDILSQVMKLSFHVDVTELNPGDKNPGTLVTIDLFEDNQF